MAVRRHFGYDQIPQSYVARVRQRTTTHFRRVRKHTTQLEWAGETYWITVLEETRAPLLADGLDIVKHFPLPDSDAVRQYSGLMSVVEMIERIQHVYIPVEQQTGELTSTLFPPTMSAMQTTLSAPQPPLQAMASAILTLSPGETAVLDDGTFLHRCGTCGVVWLSPQAEPVKCPRQRADARGAKCGTRRWRCSKE
jgi:hypothetical protein